MVSLSALCLLVCLAVTTVHGLAPDDANVCQVTKTFLEDYMTKTRVSERFKTYTWCLLLPPRCTKYITKYKLENKKAVRIRSKDEYVCCSGYKEIEGKCIAVCEPGCDHGVCIAPNICDCHSGWRGETCNSECPFGMWGDNCMQKCLCQNEGTCHVATGQCSCQPGFYGPVCQYQCPEGMFGRHCSQQCKCVQGQGRCDPVTGRCQCLPGYRGPLCEKACDPGSHGLNCESDCQCQSGGHCDPVDGSCICLAGWTGQVCANPCEEGWYGVHCLSQCYCYNGGTCNHVTGKCSCTAGYTGSKCNVQCPYGQYGMNCSEKCLCQNNARCDPVNGICTCAPGFMGPLCSYPVCPGGWYGPSCKSRCQCNASTSTCDPWGGQCYCNPGYIGITCDQACDLGWFGNNCTEKCDCKADEVCNNKFGCVAASTISAVGSERGTHTSQVYIGLFAAVFLILIILISLCLALYYRRRYRRLKQTTHLMVQYRVVTTETAPSLDGHAEEGAVGGSLSVDEEENPAHRHFSSKKQRLMRDLQEEEEEEVMGAAALPVAVSHGKESCDIPEEAPPPYTPHDSTPYNPDEYTNPSRVPDLPPAYSPGHRANRRDESIPLRSASNCGDEAEVTYESIQNATNMSRDQSPV